MNNKRLSEDFIDKNYTDCILTLTDKTTSVTLNCHKVILATHSDYFHNMFTFDKTQNQINLQVDNADIAFDVVMSFYDIKKNSNMNDWKYVLELYKCMNYFLLDTDKTRLYSLEVPESGFELLLEVLSAYDIAKDRKLIALIKKNLPDQYDSNLLSEKLREILAKDEEEEINFIKSILDSLNNEYIMGATGATGSTGVTGVTGPTGPTN